MYHNRKARAEAASIATSEFHEFPSNSSSPVELDLKTGSQDDMLMKDWMKQYHEKHRNSPNETINPFLVVRETPAVAQPSFSLWTPMPRKRLNPVDYDLYTPCGSPLPANIYSHQAHRSGFDDLSLLQSAVDSDIEKSDDIDDDCAITEQTILHDCFASSISPSY
jgi:hypothetical protein